MKPFAYFGAIALTFALLLVVHGLAFFYQLGALFPASYWSRNAKIIKNHLLASAQGRKLILIAGSSGYFGFVSWVFAEQFQVTIVNYSLHVLWPLESYFETIKPHLNAGDIVLLPLEYEYYQRTTPYTAQFVSDVMNFETDYFWNLKAGEKVHFIASTPPHRILGGVLAMLFDKRMRGIGGRGQSSPLLPAPEVVRIWRHLPLPKNPGSDYPYRLLNEYGDFVATFSDHYDGKLSYAVMKPFLYSAYAWNTLSEFARWCREHKITVFATWPPTIQDPRLNFETPTVRTHVSAIVDNYRKIGIPILGNPEDFQFDRDWFGDSQYHLGIEGRIMRTRRVAFLLAEALDSAQTPPRPQP